MHGWLTPTSTMGERKVSLLVLLVAIPCIAQINFTNVAGIGSDAANIPYAKDGGMAFTDYDLDGDLDLIVNTNDNNGARRSFLLRNDNGVYTDVTNAVAPGLKSNSRTERSAAWGDCNSDGYPDLLVNTHNRLKLLINNAGASFTLHSNFTSMTNGMNTEGLGWIDFDNDGDLDYFVENDSFGIDLMENDGATPTPTFTQVTINAVGAANTGSGGLGLPEGGSDDGDYATSVDLNNDGYVDIVARRRNNNAVTGQDRNQYDIFINDGDGSYTPLTSFNEEGDNADKGGIIVGDFDNDGDFDMLWTGGSTDGNRVMIYEHTGMNSLVFTHRANVVKRENNANETSTDFDGSALADIDNDGDLDIFLTRNSGTSMLYLNESTGPGNFLFRQPGPTWIPGSSTNFGINVGGNGEGCTFVDYDNDGDMDLYVNKHNARNQLWQNDYIGSATEEAAAHGNSYLRIIARVDLGGGISREATNASVQLLDCDGNVISGIREIGAGGAGHGAQTTPWLHFGLKDGPDRAYTARVQFTRDGTTPVIVSRSVVPSRLPNFTPGSSSLTMEQTLIITDTDVSDAELCADDDSDGIDASLDLDDDNDGILDAIECISTSTNELTYDVVSGQTISASTFRTSFDVTGITVVDAGPMSYRCLENGSNYALLFTDPVGSVDLSFGSINAATEIGDFTIELASGTILTNVDFVLSHHSNDDHYGAIALEASSDANFTARLTKKEGAPFAGGIRFVDHDGGAGEAWGVVKFIGYESDPIVELSYSISSGTSNKFVGVAAIPIVDCDFDNDNVPDQFDLDSDNDGIYDLDEAGHNGADNNNDGMLDAATVSFGQNGYSDGLESAVDNGIPSYTLNNTDGTGFVDYLDLDADDDNCPDTREAGHTDSDHDNIPGTGAPTVDPTTGLITTPAGLYTAPGNLPYDNTSNGCDLTAVEDMENVVKNNTTTFNVQDNDTHPQNDALTTTIVAGSTQGGTVTIMGTSIIYAPANEYLGLDTIIYRITGPLGFTDFDTVFINVFSPLPIELISFDAVANSSLNKVDLKWSTATERTVHHQKIQRYP